jgi:hypothetical protein
MVLSSPTGLRLLRCRKPIGFLVLAWILVLDVEASALVSNGI